MRCITAANEIASVMRMISHMDLSAMNPFISFCLYVAARVFVQYLKSRPDDSQTGDSLRFLLSAMNALKRKNPLTESFLVQLDVDLEGLGMRNPKYKSIFAYSEDNLGLSSAKMPTMGGGPNRSIFRNECQFMKVPDDAPNPMDDSPTVATGTANDFRRGSDPTSGTSDQPNWIPLPDHTPNDQGQDVQRTMQGLALGSGPRAPFGSGDLSSGGYSESSNNNDTSLSPNTGNSGSDRPTPNSTTPSEPRGNLQPGQTSGGTSYETSPASSHNAPVPPATDSRSMSSFFSTQPDYTGISATGMADNNAFTMPETPGRDFQVPPGWEMSGQTTGLTPVGEGVFRQLMGLGPMDPMDLGWEGGS